MRRHARYLIRASAGILALGVCFSLSGAAQRPPRPASSTALLEAAIAEIAAGRKTTPIIGRPIGGGGDIPVTFFARRLRDVPRIVSDATGWGEHADGTFDFNAGRMARVGRTEWYALQAKVAPRARIEYLVVHGASDYRLDPYNPRQASGPRLRGARASEFVMPGYVPPPEFAEPRASPAGLIAEATIRSRLLREPCNLTIYTPPGYRHDRTHALAVFLEARSGQVSRVLDWLIAREAIEPVVAVFVDPELSLDRARPGASIRTFVSDELLPWVAARYGVTGSAGKRAIVGISYGAKDALDAAMTRDDAFRNVGLLIPGRRIGRADIDAIAGRHTHRLRVAILAGRYDEANVATARGLRLALASAGHVVDYAEVPEGHNAVTWTHHLRFVLVSLFGPMSGRIS